MRFPKKVLWRGLAVVVTVTGMAGVVLVWRLLDDPGAGYLFLCALPFLIGGGSAIARIEMVNRILLLWAAAGLAGFVAALTIMSGAGFILLARMVMYLITAWGMNEGARHPTT